MRANSRSSETMEFAENNMSSLIAFIDNSFIWGAWRTSECLYSICKFFEFCVQKGDKSMTSRKIPQYVEIPSVQQLDF